MHREMPTAPSHIVWLYNTGEQVLTPEGPQVAILEIKQLEGTAVLSAWARHFRQHYHLDGALDEARDGTGLSRSSGGCCRRISKLF
jgi:hypothetical protein